MSMPVANEHKNLNKICKLYSFTLTVGNEEQLVVTPPPPPPSNPKKSFCIYIKRSFVLHLHLLKAYDATTMLLCSRSQHLEPGGVAAGRLHSRVVNLSLFINSTSSTHKQCFALPPDSTLYWSVV